MEINLSGVQAASESNGSTFKRVEPGLHTLTISKIEGAKSGDKDVLKVTFNSKEAEAEFTHTFFLTEKALPSLQYLITKFSGAPLEGNFSIAALSAVLVGKTQTVVVDGRVAPRQKDDKWYNNTYPTLRFAGFVLDDPKTYVHTEGDVNGYRMDRKQQMNLDIINNPAVSYDNSKDDGNDLPF